MTVLNTAPPTVAAVERAARADVAKWTTELAAATDQAAALRTEMTSAELADLAAADALAERLAAAERRTATATALRDAARQRLEAAEAASELDAAQQLRAVADGAWSVHLQHAQRTADLLAALADHEGRTFAPGRDQDPTVSDQLRAVAITADTEAADATVPLVGGYAAVRPGPVTGGTRDVVLIVCGPLFPQGEQGPQVGYSVTVDGARHPHLPNLDSPALERVHPVTITVPADAVVTLTAWRPAGVDVTDTFNPATPAGTD